MGHTLTLPGYESAMHSMGAANQLAIDKFSTGEGKTIKDLMQLRTQDVPLLEVKNPILKSGGVATKHHTYTLQGTDSQGPLEITRRYKEFNHLREVLYTRFPGLYVPPMPPKQKLVSIYKM